MAECFPGTSCLRHLALTLKDSLQDMRSNKKDKMVFHCDVALPTRVQTSLRAREIRMPDCGTKDGKRVQVAIVFFFEISDTCTQESDEVSFKS